MNERRREEEREGRKGRKSENERKDDSGVEWKGWRRSDREEEE